MWQGFQTLFANSVVYIYSSIDEAQKGERQGGSGFIVAIPSELHGPWLYVVTNRHVVLATPTPVVRLNCKDGNAHCLQTAQKDWLPHPFGDDVTVWPLQMENFQWDQAEISYVQTDWFVSQKLMFDEDIGVGDEVVLIGRFMGHDGKLRNSPALRFGNIALSSVEKIESDHGMLQESFLVEMHSLPGYSGSAVFVCSSFSNGEMSQRRFGKTREEYLDFDVFKGQMPDFRFMQTKGPYLFGIDWCHLRNKVKVNHARSVSDDYVYENTGMAGVVPAWKIMDILDSDEQIQRRQADDASLITNQQCRTDIA